MSEIWNKVYSSDASIFGDVPSNFGLNCHEEFKKHVVKKLLELGCGQGRDTTFFASNGIDVVAIDCSRVAIEAFKITMEKNLRIKPMIMQVKVFHSTVLILSTPFPYVLQYGVHR